ncbi:MAG: DNA starvation/stationary phase protection protein Dps [Sphingomonadales bacterium]|mgnify:CR=1 FL=1
MALYKTKNDLTENVRQSTVEVLQARLVEAIDLSLQTKQAHWTVKGPNFIALHELFDQLNDTVQEHVDAIAERIAMLGGTPRGTSQAVAGETQLAAYPVDIANGSDHVEALSSAYAAFGKRVRDAMNEVGDIGDEDTVDLLTGLSRDIDKSLWFIEAHAQAAS